MPPDDHGYVRRLRLIKARFTRHLLREGVSLEKDHRGEYGLWQKRFWEHTIRDDRDLLAHVDYVHINPVKHGYATRVIDWPHSTIHRYVERGSLSRDWACEPQDGVFGE
jgi:putative transposase